MPKLHTENVGGGYDARWLSSPRGLYTARTETADASAFTAVVEKFGKVPSGYPVIKTGDKVEPYTGSGDIVGHILFDQDTRYGDVAVPVFDHGRVNTEHVPYVSGSFTAPDNHPHIIYI
ncbi:hypothetical protein ACN082_09800 [Rothia sp. CCM 9417]|uniref:hypothetical protein n=1 Tax=Rothia sp. CCM 9417 TaxID=3402657 RepID=UPI003ADC1C07